MKKKIVTLLMASVLTVMCATGCGNGNQNAADNKVDANTQDTQTESVDEDQKMAISGCLFTKRMEQLLNVSQEQRTQELYI